MIIEPAPLMDRGSAANDCGRAIQGSRKAVNFSSACVHCVVAADVDLPVLHISKVVR
jgi:hypothetical protein